MTAPVLMAALLTAIGAGVPLALGLTLLTVWRDVHNKETGEPLHRAWLVIGIMHVQAAICVLVLGAWLCVWLLA